MESSSDNCHTCLPSLFDIQIRHNKSECETFYIIEDMRKVITIALTIAALLFVVGCSKDDTPEVKTRDVSFKVCVSCDNLTLNDYYGSTLVQSVHKSDVDTTYIQLRGMAYGRHELELVIDGNRGRSEFVVSDSTAKAYSLSKVNIGITVDDEWDGEIIYEF